MDTKPKWNDTVELRTGLVGKVVELDNQKPYVICVALKDLGSGRMLKKWVEESDIKQILPKL
jgi:hypothetical protein